MDKGKRFPNLALMKLARYHKERGDSVEWYNAFTDRYDVAYISKVFTFSPDYGFAVNADRVERGGTGYRDYSKLLPAEVDGLQPDYSLYRHIVDKRTAYGFLTRGCLRQCPWCIVPRKEGNLRPYMDIEQIAIEGRNRVVLMDNNVLGIDYGIEQIVKIADMGIAVDFNQDLDCRLITPDIAQLLARVKWIKYIRLACDTSAQIPHLLRACDLLADAGYHKDVFVNVLLTDDINECLHRIHSLCAYTRLRVMPFAQPYLDFKGKAQPPQWQKDMARWCNRRELLKSTDFADFSPRKNFICKNYFEKKYHELK